MLDLSFYSKKSEVEMLKYLFASKTGRRLFGSYLDLDGGSLHHLFKLQECYLVGRTIHGNHPPFKQLAGNHFKPQNTLECY